MERLEELIIKDKFTNLEKVAEILREEATALARNFFLLSGDVIVRFKKNESGFTFNVEIPASRVKSFGDKFI